MKFAGKLISRFIRFGHGSSPRGENPLEMKRLKCMLSPSSAAFSNHLCFSFRFLPSSGSATSELAYSSLLSRYRERPRIFSSRTLVLLLSRFEFSTNSISIQINFEFSSPPPMCYIYPKSLEYRINALRIALSPAIGTKKKTS